MLIYREKGKKNNRGNTRFDTGYFYPHGQVSTLLYVTPPSAASWPKYWVRVLKIALNASKKIPDYSQMIFKIPPRGPILPPLDKSFFCPKQDLNPVPSLALSHWAMDSNFKSLIENTCFKLQHDIVWALVQLFVYKTNKKSSSKVVFMVKIL